MMQQRQIKYLGLVIEKDAEQVIILNNGRDEQLVHDGVDRKYVPIREIYVKTVQHCRKVTVDGFDSRGRKDFKRTAKRLSKIACALSKEDPFGIPLY